MQFSEFLTQSAQEIDLEIKDFFAILSKDVIRQTPRIQTHIKALQTATADGKRIRGTLVILGYTLVSKIPNPELLKIAVAYELFQTAILAHDDIIDNSPMRRGKPSLHISLGGGHYGLSQALCLGDIGFFAAYKLISDSNFDDALKTKATSFFSKSIMQTVFGEMLDVEVSQSTSKVVPKDIIDVARLKTAYYTFVAPLTLGAILAGADESFAKDLQTFGENIGIAFQLQDDIHDVFGSEKSLKKKVGGDIIEGKKTLLYAKAFEKADKEQLEFLNAYYGNASCGKKEITEIKAIFEKTGARSYTESLLKEYAAKAQAVIANLTTEEHMEAMLGEIIEYVVKEKK